MKKVAACKPACSSAAVDMSLMLGGTVPRAAKSLNAESVGSCGLSNPIRWRIARLGEATPESVDDVGANDTGAGFLAKRTFINWEVFPATSGSVGAGVSIFNTRRIPGDKECPLGTLVFGAKTIGATLPDWGKLAIVGNKGMWF